MNITVQGIIRGGACYGYDVGIHGFDSDAPDFWRVCRASRGNNDQAHANDEQVPVMAIVMPVTALALPPPLLLLHLLKML